MQGKTVWGIRQGKRGIYRERVTIRLPFEVVRMLEKKAKERRLSLSDLVRTFIEKCLKEETL
jgi:predicted HicB family RNase H-like nuclease